MAIYVVQAGSSEAAALERARFVRDGFSWPAFVLAEIWLLYHRLWLALAIWIVAQGAFFWFVSPHISVATALLIGVIAHLYVGFEGNRWRLVKGERKAAITDVIAADRRDVAEAEFFRRYAPPSGVEAGPIGRVEA